MTANQPTATYEPQTDFSWDAPLVTDAHDPLEVQCGELNPAIDPHTGLWILAPWYCKKYRTCKRCAEFKKHEHERFILGLMDKGSMRVLLHSLPTSKLNQAHGIDHVKHFPQADNSTISIIETSNESIGVPLTPEMAKLIADKSIVPERKRISGKLGGKIPVGKKKEEEEPAILNRRKIRIVDEDNNPVDKDTLRTLEREVVEETQDLEPTTPDEVQYALYRMEEVTAAITARHNLTTLFLRVETIKCYKSKINWKERKEWLKNSPKN